MKKILINTNRIEVMNFERKLNQEQSLFNEAVEILNKTGISITDDNLLDDLLLHYVSPLNITAENPLKLLPLTEDSNNYYRVKEIMDSLTFPLEVYTESGKELHIESMQTYLEDAEEIKVYNRLKKISDSMLAEDIDRAVIKEALNRWNWDWNPYNTDQIQLSLYNFRHGIQATKEIKESRISIAQQKKAREAKQMA